jgi:hypothetical protein
VVTLFAALRSTWPVRASLLLACGAWETIMVCTMLLHWYFTLTSLGAAYVAGDAALRATLILAATAANGLREAFHNMNSFALAIIWIIISLLPPESGCRARFAGSAGFLRWRCSRRILASRW